MACAYERDIEWKDVTGGVKRIVRIKFPGQGVIKWQFKRADEEMWDYDIASQGLAGAADKLKECITAITLLIATLSLSKMWTLITGRRNG